MRANDMVSKWDYVSFRGIGMNQRLVMSGCITYIMHNMEKI